MRILKKLPFVLSLIALCALIISSGNIGRVPDKKEKKDDILAANSTDDEEMRGVWVSYIELALKENERSFDGFKTKFNKIADTAKKKKFNTLVVQVRPFSDALYNSSYYPYSHLLTGRQGKKPGYDPLLYMCEYTHRLGMKLHAWINPYRVRNTSDLKLDASNPYKNNPELGVKVGKGIFYNPALPNVRKLIENGIYEIVKNYDVDGIQFDDYFYPTQSKSFDKKQYSDYVRKVGTERALSLRKWRMTNVNILIAECYGIIHNTKKNVVFGISPQGNIENDYDLCADVKSWCAKAGYIDYICPQLYYSLKNPALRFETALTDWVKLDYHKNVTLYIGIAGYKTGTDSDSGTWSYSDKILQDEVKLVRKKKLKGFMFFSYVNLKQKRAAKEVSNLVEILD